MAVSKQLPLCGLSTRVNVICSRAGHVTFPRVSVKGILEFDTLFYYLLLPVQTVLIVLALVSSRQESEKSIKMVWHKVHKISISRNYGYRCVPRNHHLQNNL